MRKVKQGRGGQNLSGKNLTPVSVRHPHLPECSSTRCAYRLCGLEKMTILQRISSRWFEEDDSSEPELCACGLEQMTILTRN